MFEVEEEFLENLAKEYEVNINTVREYAIALQNCPLLRDEETYQRLLENTVSMLNPIVIREIRQESIFSRRSKKDILTKALEITFNTDEEEISDSVDVMLQSIEEKRK